MIVVGTVIFSGSGVGAGVMMSLHVTSSSPSAQEPSLSEQQALSALLASRPHLDAMSCSVQPYCACPLQMIGCAAFCALVHMASAPYGGGRGVGEGVGLGVGEGVGAAVGSGVGAGVGRATHVVCPAWPFV